MDSKLTYDELDTEMVSLLPSKETLHFHSNWANVYASNSALALNAGSYFSQANALAYQNVSVNQS